MSIQLKKTCKFFSYIHKYVPLIVCNDSIFKWNIEVNPKNFQKQTNKYTENGVGRDEDAEVLAGEDKTG